MLSKNLNNLIAGMRAEITSESQHVALDFAVEQLVQQAPLSACLRCHKAQFFVEFVKPEPKSKFKEWFFCLGSCGAGIALEPQAFGSGLVKLDAPFCSGQNADVGTHSQGTGKKIKTSAAMAATTQAEVLKFSQRRAT